MMAFNNLWGAFDIREKLCNNRLSRRKSVC